MSYKEITYDFFYKKNTNHHPFKKIQNWKLDFSFLKFYNILTFGSPWLALTSNCHLTITHLGLSIYWMPISELVNPLQNDSPSELVSIFPKFVLFQ
jgi:hypothetical protein